MGRGESCYEDHDSSSIMMYYVPEYIYFRSDIDDESKFLKVMRISDSSHLGYIKKADMHLYAREMRKNEVDHNVRFLNLNLKKKTVTKDHS